MKASVVHSEVDVHDHKIITLALQIVLDVLLIQRLTMMADTTLQLFAGFGNVVKFVC